METTPVYAVMTSEVYAVAADTSLEAALRLLTKRGVSGAPVVCNDGHVQGSVSLSDLVDPDRPHSRSPGYATYFLHTRLAQVEFGDHVPAGEGTVADVMSREFLSIEANSTMAEAALQLADSEAHRLLVVHGGRLVGIITSHDVLRGLVLGRTRARSAELP